MIIPGMRERLSDRSVRVVTGYDSLAASEASRGRRARTVTVVCPLQGHFVPQVAADVTGVYPQRGRFLCLCYFPLPV